jgi:geranylgeranyl pyrophosphate synthase
MNAVRPAGPSDRDRAPYVEAAHEFGLDEVEKFLSDVDRHLEPYLRRSAAVTPRVEPLHEGVLYQVQTGGKRLRAALCATSCELFCGTYLRALSFAAAVEHLQNFTLIHDDIADGDSERRGQQSVWKRYGVGHAINIGDVFVALAALAILDSLYSPEIKLRLMRAVADCGLEIAEGQELDINLRQNDDPTLDQYVECTRKKTGAFLAMATVGGGIIGGAHDEDARRLREFALLAGVAFQIKDDVLDLTGGKGRTVGSDILEGKRTLIVAFIAQHGSPADKERLMQILNKPRDANTPEEVEWTCDLYRRAGAIDYAEGVAEQLVEQAYEHVAELPESEAKYRLLRISRYLSRRVR